MQTGPVEIAKTARSGRPVAVRLTSAEPLFYYDDNDLALGPGDRVVVESDQGTTIATVIITGDLIEVADLDQPLLPVLERLALPATDQPVNIFGNNCTHQPCCQNWQRRFNPSGTGCTLFICKARFEPGQYERMRQDLPAIGEHLCGPVGMKPAPSNKDKP